mmetsp:Transcript_35616/g.77020  ORF Transcript_35616/g.77020 Transcript_35616/m.77020 type:complete len:208 (+) Transcript_35616:699-1322(+)
MSDSMWFSPCRASSAACRWSPLFLGSIASRTLMPGSPWACADGPASSPMIWKTPSSSCLSILVCSWSAWVSRSKPLIPWTGKRWSRTSVWCVATPGKLCANASMRHIPYRRPPTDMPMAAPVPLACTRTSWPVSSPWPRRPGTCWRNSWQQHGNPSWWSGRPSWRCRKMSMLKLVDQPGGPKPSPWAGQVSEPTEHWAHWGSVRNIK